MVLSIGRGIDNKKIGTLDKFGAGITDAYGIASDGTNLYINTRNPNARFYSTNPITGQATRIGTLEAFGVGENRPTAMVFHNNTLYMTGFRTNNLYTVNVSTGQATRVGSATNFDVNETLPWDMASHNGKLYLVGWGSISGFPNNVVGKFYEVNTSDGTATQIGSDNFGLTQAAAGQPSMLVSYNNKLFVGFHGNDSSINSQFKEINPSTGAISDSGFLDGFGTPANNYGRNFSGATVHQNKLFSMISTGGLADSLHGLYEIKMGITSEINQVSIGNKKIRKISIGGTEIFSDTIFPTRTTVENFNGWNVWAAHDVNVNEDSLGISWGYDVGTNTRTERLFVCDQRDNQAAIWELSTPRATLIKTERIPVGGGVFVRDIDTEVYGRVSGSETVTDYWTKRVDLPNAAGTYYGLEVLHLSGGDNAYILTDDNTATVGGRTVKIFIGDGTKSSPDSTVNTPQPQWQRPRDVTYYNGKLYLAAGWHVWSAGTNITSSNFTITGINVTGLTDSGGWTDTYLADPTGANYTNFGQSTSIMFIDDKPWVLNVGNRAPSVQEIKTNRRYLSDTQTVIPEGVWIFDTGPEVTARYADNGIFTAAAGPDNNIYVLATAGEFIYQYVVGS